MTRKKNPGLGQATRADSTQGDARAELQILIEKVRQKTLESPEKAALILGAWVHDEMDQSSSKVERKASQKKAG